MQTIVTTAANEDGSTAFEIREQRDTRGRVSLVLTGDFDHEANAAVDTVVGRVWGGGADVVEVVVDLTGVTFFNGHGLAALLTVQRAARVRRSTLVVRCLPGSVMRTLGLVGLADHPQEAHPTGAAGMRLCGNRPMKLSARRGRDGWPREVSRRMHSRENWTTSGAACPMPLSPGMPRWCSSRPGDAGCAEVADAGDV